MVLTTLSFLGLAISMAEEEVQSCETRLISKHSLRYLNSLRLNPSVHFIGELKGDHSGTLSILEALNKEWSPSWASQYQVQPRAPQGDPRQIVSLLGAQLAYFFGFREVDDYAITIPDIKEINGALAKLNAALIELGYEPIQIGFYSQGPSEKGSYYYITHFYEKGLLPMAPRGLLRVHDISYHLPAIILNQVLLKPVMEKYRRAIEFYHFAIERSTDEQTRARLEKYLNVLEMRIDAGLGNIPSAFVKRARQEFTTTMEEELRRKYKNKVEREKAKQELEINFMRGWLESTWKTAIFDGENEPGMVDLALRAAMHNDFADADSIWKIYDAFWGQEKFKGFKDIPTNFPTGEEIHKQIITRHTQLIKALVHIKKKELQ